RGRSQSRKRNRYLRAMRTHSIPRSVMRSSSPSCSQSSLLGRDQAQEQELDVEPEQNHVAVADFVLFSFKPQFACFAGFRERTGRDQIVAVNGFRRDKTAFEIGVDRSGSGWRLFAGVNGPSARLLFAGGKKRVQPEQMIDRANERVYTAVLHAEAA